MDGRAKETYAVKLEKALAYNSLFGDAKVTVQSVDACQRSMKT